MSSGHGGGHNGHELPETPSNGHTEGGYQKPWLDRLSLRQGDIAEAETEAIVNAANHELWMGSGVAGALKRAGGAVIEQEALRQAPIAVGESVITSGGKLRALYVIHAAAQAAGRPATSEAVAAATLSALRLAAREGIESVAFPALGTGAARLGFGECAAAMYTAMREHCQSSELPQRIELWLWGDNAMAVFREMLEAFMS